jgi:hypothetical protein
MTYKITETITTLPWLEGLNNAPAELVTRAKIMAEQGTPVNFGKNETNNWVILSISEANNLAYVVARG